MAGYRYRLHGRQLASFKHATVIALAIALTAGAAPHAGASDEDQWRPPALSADGELPDARDVVRRVGEFMNSNQQLSFEALVSYEAVQESGQKLHFDMLQSMKISKPDKFSWVTLHDNGAFDSGWFDAGTFTLLRQPANIWGQVALPADLPTAINRLVEEYELAVPFADVLAGNPLELWLDEDVTLVEFVAEAWVEGNWTDHIAIRKPGRDIELWILKGDKPFPMRVSITFTDETLQPTYIARFRKWSTSKKSSSVEPFSPPAGSERVDVIPVSESPMEESR